MASKIREGQSIYIPFLNGESVQDSQLRPRMYGSEKQFKAKYPGFRVEKPRLVEYAPVVRCKDCKNNPDLKTRTKNMLWCRKWQKEVRKTDFCSYGERKEE